MNAPLYTNDILRWKLSLPNLGRLNDPQGTAKKRSPICGSEIAVDMDLTDGKVSSIGLLVRACAFGEASTSIFAAHAVGRTPDELLAVRDEIEAWLERGGPQPDWPDIGVLEPAQRHASKRPVIRLVFEAAAEAATQAASKDSR